MRGLAVLIYKDLQDIVSQDNNKMPIGMDSLLLLVQNEKEWDVFVFTPVCF